MKTPSQQEMQEFAQRARADLASAYLALPKIKKHGLDLDHPRAAKFARGEMNRSTRSEWSLGIGLDQAETLAAAPSGDSQVADLIEKCRAGLADETFAPGQIDELGEDERRIQRMLELKNQLKPRDREILELRFEQGLSIKEIAERVEKTDGAIYAAFHKLKPELRGIKERQDWVDEHCGLDKLAGGVDAAPVILRANQQLGWDLGGAE